MHEKITEVAALLGTLMTVRGLTVCGTKTIDPKEAQAAWDEWYAKKFVAYKITALALVEADTGADIHVVCNRLEKTFLERGLDLTRKHLDVFCYDDLMFVQGLTQAVLADYSCRKYMEEAKAGVEHDPMKGIPLPLGTIPPLDDDKDKPA